MAIIQAKVDDITREPVDEEAGGETILFSYRGTPYTIDLTAVNVKTFDDVMEPFIRSGRKASQPSSSRKGRKEPDERGARIRAWARAQVPLVHVAERGRVPASVVQQYEAATGS